MNKNESIKLVGFSRNTVEAAFKRKYPGQFEMSVSGNEIYVRKRRPNETANDKSEKSVPELMDWNLAKKAIDYYIEATKKRDYRGEILNDWIGENRLVLKRSVREWQLPCFMLEATKRYNFQRLFRIRPGSSSIIEEPVYSTLEIGTEEKYLSNGIGLGHIGKIRIAIDINNDYSDYYDLEIIYPAKDKKKVEADFKQLCAIGESLYLYKNKHLRFDNSCLVEIDAQNVEMKSVYLGQHTKKSVLDNVTDFFSTYKLDGFKSHRGALVSGPVGNGKTLLAKAIATHIVEDATVLWVTGASIGEPSDIRSLFDIARALSPVFVVMEDIDGLGTSRETTGNPTGPVLAELLTQMDGAQENKGIFVYATTNYPEMVDNALKNRPNRFDRHYRIPNPTLDMLKLYLRNKLGFECDSVALKLEKHNFAYAEELVNTARLLALKEKRKITLKDVEAAWDDLNAPDSVSDVMVG